VLCLKLGPDVWLLLLWEVERVAVRQVQIGGGEPVRSTCCPSRLSFMKQLLLLQQVLVHAQLVRLGVL
jgi:hypothetical protein